MGIVLTKQQRQHVEELLHRYPQLKDVVAHINQRGGTVYLVGGAVRDSVLGLPITDVDIEVHNLSLDALRTILQQFGHVELVGKAFGVLKVFGLPIDWALPRTDTSGRKPQVKIDEHMAIEDALRRRDVTMNAMAINLATLELIDPFGGYDDLQTRTLRAVDPQFFGEDPLRLFRVMQFCGRFGMDPDEQLNTLCRSMSLKGISRERIEKEVEKLLLLSKQPSRGFRWLLAINRLTEIFPELAALIGVPQSSKWHPEGDVFEHTMQAIDAAAALTMDDRQRLIIVYAALCHDLGKAVTTQLIGDTIISYEHEIAGVPLARALLKRITHNSEIIDTVALLVRYHMSPGMLAQQRATVAAYKRLARKLAPLANLQMLALLATADRQGRNGEGHMPLTGEVPQVAAFLEKAQEAAVLQEQEPPILQGRDLLDVVAPGPQLGELVKRAYEIQINKNIKDKSELKKRVLSGYKKT